VKFSTWWRRHGIAIFGYIAAAIPGLLGIEGLVPKAQTKYWLATGLLVGLAIARFNYTNQQGPKP
jgi:hypothetical protein